MAGAKRSGQQNFVPRGVSSLPKPKQISAKKRLRQPFPSVALEKALEVPSKIKELNGGNPWTPADVASAIEASPKSSDFYYVTAASRDFGLTTGTRDTETIELTDFGREVVYAPDPNTERAKKIAAFNNIELFQKVLAHYKGSDLPEMKYLGNTLQRDFGLDPKFHEDFSRVFRENCRYLNIASGEAFSPAETGAGVHSPVTVVVGEPKDKSKLKAFVIMPFGEKHSQRAAGFFSEVLASLITPAGVQAGFTVETANRQGSDVIQSTIVNELLEADLVIADLTDHNPNVLFELGLRMAENRPVALIKVAGTGPLFDVDNMLRVHEYNGNLWRSTIESDLPALSKHIKATWENRDKVPSYMTILRRQGDRKGG